MSTPCLTADSAFFTDLDGTLVEIAGSPDSVSVDPGLAALLRRAGERLDGALAIVSGRNVATVDAMLDGAVRAVVGVHGLERRDTTGALIVENVPGDLLTQARVALGDFVRDHAGVLLEDKGVALALHFRQAPEHGPACLAAIEAVLARSEGMVVQHGKMVAELLGAAHTKDDAVACFLEEAPFVGRRPVFIGDDITDEASFRLVNARGGWSVRVGDAQGSAARFRLPDVAAVHRWLAAFADG